MAINDPVADMLTRIRNAARNKSKHVACVNNKVCRGIAQALLEEGYIKGFDVLEVPGKSGVINVALKYGPRGEHIIHELTRASKPGRRVYSKVKDIPRPMQGLGISIVSTSSGVMSDRKAREQNVGGELLCTVL
ncbi:MAG: 30S ribosomal protein S8 [Phycisphaeraceae bacterium]|nr:MAG: 30S ribosomal protein S8 [Phycisphaeraceae bacterium]